MILKILKNLTPASLALKKDWNFISPNEFYKIISGKKKIIKKSTLLSMMVLKVILL